jgi:RNA polymerase primary sigma factor
MAYKKMNKEELLIENRRYVEAVAKQYLNQGLTLGQLIEEGNKGLVKAADLYDESKGSSFIAYAVWWVRKSILKALADMQQGKPNLDNNK